MKFLAVSLGAVILVAPGVSLAQVTQTYGYDANGRLTGVVTSGSAGTHTSAYAYDGAHNRTSRSQTGTTAWAALSPDDREKVKEAADHLNKTEQLLKATKNDRAAKQLEAAQQAVTALANGKENEAAVVNLIKRVETVRAAAEKQAAAKAKAN